MRTIGTALALLTAAAVVSGVAAAGNGPAATRSPDPLIIRVQDGGFRWGDAAIGAAAGFGASLVVVGGLAVKRDPMNARAQSYEKGEKS